MSKRLSTAERLDRTVLESLFQSQVLQLAGLLRWRRAHFRPGLNRRGEWQTAVQDGISATVAEIAAAQAGVESHVWRPSDFRSGLIQRRLGSTGKP